ncbi:unnamed protein product [Clonostachys rosea f. rosea IK726]|jgi:hypothetical protein|uniref:Uncharacterized protein n=2 Tax=Bionectria ochroleuca TaxID=29856 RepID=A0A0B7KJL2_BIOOC|nr:unnamed protein product [Clonostachys rosea f. rosea IK726]
MAEEKKNLVPQSLNRLDSSLTVTTIPERAALSNVSTVCASPLDKTPRSSKETGKSNPFETDLEAGTPTRELSNCVTRTQTGQKDCQVWPDKSHWERKAKLAKAKNRTCGCMNRMSKRNRIITKVVIILLIIGLGLGIGFGISKPLGAKIWGDNTKST